MRQVDRSTLLSRLSHLWWIAVPSNTSNKLFTHIQELEWLDADSFILRSCSHDNSLAANSDGFNHAFNNSWHRRCVKGILETD